MELRYLSPMDGGTYTAQSVGSTAATLTLTGCPRGTRVVSITVEGAAVRVRIDGTAPTTTVGVPLAVGTTVDWSFDMAQAAKVIAQSGTATLHIVPLKA